MRYWIIILIIILASCSTDKSTDKNTDTNDFKPKPDVVDIFDIITPISFDTLIINEVTKIEIEINDSVHHLDSIQIVIEGKVFHTDSRHRFSLPIKPQKVGLNNLGLKVYLQSGLSQYKSIEILFLSDIVPITLNYKIIQRYPHSTNSFTQGLVYQDKCIYEGTGDWGKSAILKSDLETGKIIQSTRLSSSIFGEGIAIINDKIIQLTYKSMHGYVYDKNTFNLIRKFPYPIPTEGWGLTTDGKDLIMSNGTDKVYIMDSSYYSIINEIHVCDNKESIDSLNELEFVDGLLYSNIWMDNRIAQIDYKSGKVLGYIDLSDNIPSSYRNHHSDVLNGVAVNLENGNLFVTGKRWPSIYEIQLD